MTDRPPRSILLELRDVDFEDCHDGSSLLGDIKFCAHLSIFCISSELIFHLFSTLCLVDCRSRCDSADPFTLALNGDGAGETSWVIPRGDKGRVIPLRLSRL